MGSLLSQYEGDLLPFFGLRSIPGQQVGSLFGKGNLKWNDYHPLGVDRTVGIKLR